MKADTPSFAAKYRLGELARMLSLLGKKKAAFVGALAGCCLSPVANGIVGALITKTMLDAALARDMSRLVEIAYLAAVMVLAACVLDPLFRYFYARLYRQVIRDARVALFDKLERLPIAYFERNHSGDTLSRMTADMAAMESAFGTDLVSLVVIAGQGVAATATMLILDWRFALPIMAIGFAFAKTSLYFMVPYRAVSDEIQTGKARSYQYLSDLVAGLRVLRFCDFRTVERRFDTENSRVADATLRRARIGGAQTSVNHLFATACYIGTLIVGALLVDRKSVSFGSLLAIMSLQQHYNYMIQFLGEFLSRLQESLAGAARVFTIMDAVEEPGASELSDVSERTATNEVSAAADVPALAFKDVVFGYESERRVLDGVSFEARIGKMVAIAGASGSGKTTIATLALRLRAAAAGSILLNGTRIDALSPAAARRLVSYVPQDAYLFSGTILENIRHGRVGASDDEVKRAAREAYADVFIDELPDSYHTKVGERGFQISGGQRQRIAIARALLKDAPILILDEATSALDSASEAFIRHSLREAAKDRAVVVIAHRFTTIESADEILVLSGGRFVERGTHDSLMRLGGVYRALREAGEKEA